MGKNLKTIDIKGKAYVMVKDRIIAFNEEYKNGSITTELVKNDDISVVFKATVCPDKSDGRCFTGYSEAYRGQGQMGSVPVEVAETSAVGRALAMMGIGIIESVASADEIHKASVPAGNGIMASEAQISKILELGIQKGKTILKENLSKLSMVQASGQITELMNLPDKAKSNASIKQRDAVEMEEGYELPTIPAE